MGFWTFLFIVDLIIPIIMMVGGRYFLNGGPRNINGVAGYRTMMSMKNQETWKFAHEYCGQIWWVHGGSLLVLSIITMLLVIRKSEASIGIVGGVLCTIQCIWIVGTIIPVERALRKNFDKNGNRK